MNIGQMAGVGGFGLCLGWNVHEFFTPSNLWLVPVAFGIMALCGLLAVYSTPK